MRDSRLGTYGALILMVAFATKLSALNALPNANVVRGLIAAHALSRGILPFLSMMSENARKDGLAANAGRPALSTAATAGIFALGIAMLMLHWQVALAAGALAATCGIGMGWLAHRQIGGITGDVLGAAEQLSETAVLLLVAALHPVWHGLG